MENTPNIQKTFLEKLNLASFWVFGLLGITYIILEIIRINALHPEQIMLLEKSLDLPLIFTGLVYVMTLIRIKFAKYENPYFDQILISIGLIIMLVVGYLSLFVDDLVN